MVRPRAGQRGDAGGGTSGRVFIGQAVDHDQSYGSGAARVVGVAVSLRPEASPLSKTSTKTPLPAVTARQRSIVGSAWRRPTNTASRRIAGGTACATNANQHLAVRVGQAVSPASEFFSDLWQLVR